jgi:hypothetical protein
MGSVILAAKPIASHRAEGERRESWPGRSGCRRVLDRDSGPEMGTSLGHPTVRNPVGGHARERHGGAGRRGPDRQGAGGYGCPGASILYLGSTLSDKRGEGERAHCRSAPERSHRYGPASTRRTGFCVQSRARPILPVTPAIDDAPRQLPQFFVRPRCGLHLYIPN